MATLVATLSEEGVAPAAVLRDADLRTDQLGNPDSRISYRQLFTVLANACRLATTPTTALRAGQRTHLSSFGMYGYALMTCAGSREAIAFAARYYEVIGPTAAVAFSDRHGICSWQLQPLLALRVDAPLYRFLAELQLSTHVTLHRDLLGPEFAPVELRVAYPRPAHRAAYEPVFRCAVCFDQPADEIRVGNAWLEQRFAQANAVSHAQAARHCADDLARIRALAGTAGAVRALIAQAPERFASMDAAAAALGLHERTLRRRLKAEGASFHDLLRQTRLEMSVELLERRATNEDIAGRIGYSDAASFRHAFKRWTAAPPNDYRARPA
ncbi:MAG TPA: AraC family transcriptional regulator [Burkholderiaceae bacterium]|nr:AraC family transcriptional regulator [Burkholderiaceae bacterium]